MGRAPCCDKAKVKKGPWSPEEDASLKSYIHQNGTGGNWITLPQKIGLKRCGKSCRLRWLNYLRPNIKHGGFSEEEDNIICSLYISIGSRWSIIAAQLPGRTDNDVKNYWNTRLKKKLLGKQRREKQERRNSSASANNKNYNNILITQNPLPQMVLPPIPYSNQEPRFNDHSSIRKLLIKLGGKFSNLQNDVTKPLIHEEEEEDPIKEISNSDIHQQMFYTQSNIDLVCPNFYPLHLPNEPHFMNGVDITTSTLQGQNGNYENPLKLQGLEFLYEDDHILNCTTSNGTYNNNCIDWGHEMNSLGFPSNYNNSEGVEEVAIDHDKMTTGYIY
ncbi:hypothetical protein RD792_012470 [Penstemon davidsonii]|uniref:Uncharacterized protein n=1 Tax=Penstemon davidsonii TaxID=160366 RepID=A0ABR0CYY7_9LAMI|nr:hypothetical protein RD792_012470 [Penstemon davidsonii]